LCRSVIDRRRFLEIGLVAAASGCARRTAVRAPDRTRCAEPTPEDLAGPFLPRRYQGDADLTRVPGQAARAQGETILIRGRVTDDGCRPLAGARLEVWQANTFGRYADDRDHSGRPLDAGFQGSALIDASGDGEYSILTVKPGTYRGTASMRAPHVHFRISAPGCHDDITQMYFAGEALNASDENLALLAEAERRRLIVATSGREQGASLHAFDIVLRRIEPGIELAPYAGHYVIDDRRGPMPVTLTVEGGKLYADSPPLPKVELRPLSPTRFRLKAFNVVVDFDAGGFTVTDQATGERSRASRR
jgi:protocatechuate 3,4-dioxygenase beta subunit